MTEEQKNQAAQLRLMKVQTGILAAMLAIVIGVGIFLMLQAGVVVKTVQSLDMTKIAETVESLEQVAGELRKLDMDAVNQGIRSLSDAADVLAQVDIEAVNQSIGALAEAGEQLSALDIEKLNTLMESLSGVVTDLEKAVGVLGKLFGR